MKDETLTTKTLLLFFIPLGLSASLVTLSHIIINSTLARAVDSEVIIATYAIAMSVFGITERLAVILRQTTSTLVRDRESFRRMTHFSYYTIGAIMFVSAIIAYTQVGDFVFSQIFGVQDQDMVDQIQTIYQILIYVTIFSGLRCLNQGIIIYNRQTKWLTIGMIIRLAAMYLLSLYFIKTGNISGVTGAYIFLVGMMIECTISMVEARTLVRKMPENNLELEKINSKSQIFKFYSPLMMSSFITVLIGPIINVFLGKTTDITLAIASYTIALSITHLFISFFSYTHQIVINFYKDHEDQVKKFTMMISFLPFILIAGFCYSGVGEYAMEHLMGVNGRLLEASLQSLQVFMIMALVYPFIDFFNGLLLIRKQTKVTIISQSTNLILTVIFLIIGVSFASEWNGVIGALAQSLGFVAELIIVMGIIKHTDKIKSQQTRGLTPGGVTH
ncbi:multi antimicrobial extrusion protein MatE [Bacillus luteolus]|uniref:Multi antimicrobial extrusion protein MatE n=1 Tax=Litchfieldia luteola TaxID=682179 RepID=A0ABR9QMD3_9BACI|nr:multi antimicrobial extrusion protein MatE [Cytobacillus luteolus]MBE4909658.1 multi antimicrobial extrusion protein MatE [Cytobacillus luteolus]MBP1941059.1 Na+-driven multidrug efflux pump [Cytobacillus luteolus]